MNVFNSLEDTMTDFFMTGKFGFKDFVNSILKDMARMASQNFVQGLAGMVGQGMSWLFNSSGGYRGAGTYGVTPGASTNWHASGGLITEPIVGKGLRTGSTHVFGEAGAELVTPLSKLKSGESKVNVTVNNYSNEKASVQETTSANGTRQILVQIGNDIRRMGPVGQSIGQRFGLQPKGLG